MDEARKATKWTKRRKPRSGRSEKSHEAPEVALEEFMTGLLMRRAFLIGLLLLFLLIIALMAVSCSKNNRFMGRVNFYTYDSTSGAHPFPAAISARCESLLQASKRPFAAVIPLDNKSSYCMISTGPTAGDADISVENISYKGGKAYIAYGIRHLGLETADGTQYQAALVRLNVPAAKVVLPANTYAMYIMGTEIESSGYPTGIEAEILNILADGKRAEKILEKDGEKYVLLFMGRQNNQMGGVEFRLVAEHNQTRLVYHYTALEKREGQSYYPYALVRVNSTEKLRLEEE